MLIVGHSHINCIVDAARAAGLAIPSINLWLQPNAIAEGENGPELSAELGPNAAGIIISSIGGGPQHVMGLNPHPHIFDFIAPEQPDLPIIDGATMLPRDQIRQTMQSVGAADFRTLRLLGEAAPGRVIHIPPPPTLRDEKPIDHQIWRDLVGHADRVSPPYFRKKLEMIHTSILREICTSANIILAPPPPSAVDDEGFLLPEFAGVPCHGNSLYGALVLEQIRTLTA